MKSPFVHLRSQAPDRPREGIISGPVAFFLLPETASARRWPGTDREEVPPPSVPFLLLDPEPLWHESAPRGSIFDFCCQLSVAVVTKRKPVACVSISLNSVAPNVVRFSKPSFLDILCTIT